MDRIQNTASNSYSIVASRSCGTNRVENTSSQLVYWCMLGICCLATGIVYRVITQQRVYVPLLAHLMMAVYSRNM
jgi:hypothetical protein